ncbi:MAG TPA: ATP-binding cassette domain-containing protein [Hellea balneolensis]|uniref:ATP-binding cassette domain-containing protein n=1 Tax=Hellea balneolensis TaxID=287478 RepID=A0A7C5QSR0_9PROT|nr:ATP-binding cassette domain-containing protein [Hellea balneolensis]
MRPYRGRLALAIFFMIVLAATTAAYGWLVKHIIDVANSLNAKDGITLEAGESAKIFAVKIVPVVIGVTLVSGVSMFIQSILTNSVALNTIGRLQKAMFASIHRADYAQIQSEPTGNLISRFTNDVTILSQALLRTMTNLVREILTVIFCIGMMFYFDWLLSLLVLGVYPLAALPIIAISKKLRGNSKDAQAHIGVITAQLGESLSGARMVRTYGLEDYEHKRLGKSFDERVRLYLKLVTNQARVDPILEVLGGIAIAGVFALGVYRVVGGHTTAGAIAGLLTMVLAISPRIRALGTLNNVVQEGLAALHRIFDVIDRKPTITEPLDALTLNHVKGDISVQNVSFRYPDGTLALDNISFQIKPGETVALVGPSGGGKSTILNILTRLYDPDEGLVAIDGHDMRGVTLESLRKSMALVSQDITVFDDTVAANIGFGDLSADRSTIINAAKAANAHDFIQELPNGYDTRVGEDGGKLSGGQKQRIALARAILKDAPILLLDEATSALDAESEAKVSAALAKLTKGRTVIVIAHRLSTVKTADRILVLENGQITESGTHAQLLEQKGLYAKLCALQFS